MASVCCRVCLESVEQKYSIALFGDVGMRMKWANRLEELLRVPVSASDSFPPYICRACRGKVETVEKKLSSLRYMAHASYEKLSGDAVANRKRTKHTSSAVGISPSTAKARPPAKRCTPRQLFSACAEDETNGEYSYIF